VVVNHSFRRRAVHPVGEARIHGDEDTEPDEDADQRDQASAHACKQPAPAGRLLVVRIKDAGQCIPERRGASSRWQRTFVQGRQWCALWCAAAGKGVVER
jgi:hypothetical protein